jgi:hypothetical protein
LFRYAVMHSGPISDRRRRQEASQLVIAAKDVHRLVIAFRALAKAARQVDDAVNSLGIEGEHELWQRGLLATDANERPFDTLRPDTQAINDMLARLTECARHLKLPVHGNARPGALLITRRTRSAYEALMGEDAKAGVRQPVSGQLDGPFVQLVRDAFAACEISNSADWYIRQALYGPPKRKARARKSRR